MAVTADEQIKAYASNIAQNSIAARAGAAIKARTAALQQSNVKSAPSAPTAATTAVKQPTSRSNETLGRIDSLINQQPFQFQAPAAFSYNKDTDPAYQAALAAAQANIQQGQADTNARLRAGGQGKSSYSESVANQISAKEMGNVSTNVLPQLISQAYQRYADDANRSLQLQQLNYGAQQDQIAQLGNLYGMYDQQDFRNPLLESEVTGNYLPGEARNYINSILELKRKAETPGITAQERAGLSQQADAYRAALQGLGINPNAYGADQTANQATASFDAGAGIRTLAGQQMDLQRKQANLDAARQVGSDTGRLITPQDNWMGLYNQAKDSNTPLNLAGQQFAYGQQRDQVGDGQWQKQFDEDVRRFGLNYTLQKNAQTLSSDANLRAWAEMAYGINGNSSQSKYTGMSPAQIISSIGANYMETIPAAVDKNGRPVMGATPTQQMTTDKNRRYQMFLDVVYANLPDDTAENQVLLGLGFSQAEIKEMEARAAKEYGVGN